MANTSDVYIDADVTIDALFTGGSPPLECDGTPTFDRTFKQSLLRSACCSTTAS